MAVGQDFFTGCFFLISCFFSVVYYTLWVIGLPLLEPVLSVHQFFPDNNFAVQIPLAAIIVIFLGLTAFSQYLMKFK